MRQSVSWVKEGWVRPVWYGPSISMALCHIAGALGSNRCSPFIEYCLSSGDWFSSTCPVHNPSPPASYKMPGALEESPGSSASPHCYVPVGHGASTGRPHLSPARSHLLATTERRTRAGLKSGVQSDLVGLHWNAPFKIHREGRIRDYTRILIIKHFCVI